VERALCKASRRSSRGEAPEAPIIIFLKKKVHNYCQYNENLLVDWSSSICNDHLDTSLIGKLFCFVMDLQINHNITIIRDTKYPYKKCVKLSECTSSR